MEIATAILALIQNAPAAISEITALYNVVKSNLSSSDQSTIDQALVAIQASDAQATARADDALDAASRR